MTEASARGRIVFSFGRFELVPSERLLTENGVRVELGARALDTLIALASRPNQALAKRELMAEVWPDATVDEGALRFHMAALRKALGDGKDGARYIATLAGRGYCFVAPVTRSIGPPGMTVAMDVVRPRATFLPPRLERMVGREDAVGAIAAELSSSRLVSIVGPGGVGKTTVAVAVAHDLMASFDGAVLFVDFGVLSDARMAPSSVASMLGISIRSDDSTPSLIAHLSDKRMLLVLDNCEHVVEPAAELTSRIFLAAPDVHILATSREPLRIDGERVHRLAPLGVPPDDTALNAAATMSFPAAKLFLERATASGAHIDLEDANAEIVASICRKLDGMALAIELAAGRVEAYGLRQTAALLDQRFALLWPGQRTAPARQQTLRATLDWSYGLLSEQERVVFRRLAAFVGSFSIESALAVVTNETIDVEGVFAAIDSLVAKSMLTAFPVGAMMRYRLLDTARAYALEVSGDSERAALAARHAAYCLRWLEPFAADRPPLSAAHERAAHLAGLHNVRAALTWCFGPEGDVRLGVRLAAAATFAFLALSLTNESHHWSRTAILALDEANSRGVEEMHLQAGLALSSMFKRGNGEEARIALSKSLAIAEERGDDSHQMRMLSLLHMFHHRAGDAREAHVYATRGQAVASRGEDPAAVALARAQLGISFTLAGDLGDARVEFEAALRQSGIFLQAFDYRAITRGYLARVLWLQGYPEQARESLRANVAEAVSSGHPVSLAFALSFTVPLLLWLGDLDAAEAHAEWFFTHTQSHSLPLSLATGRGFRGQLAIARGEARAGLEMLEDSLRDLGAANYNVWETSFNISRGQGLFGLGRFAEALSLIDDTIRKTRENGDQTYIPELLRMKASVLRAMEPDGPDDADLCVTNSLEWSRRQGARSSELRAAIDLAESRLRQNRSVDARAVLRPVFEAFEEGFDTADLARAKRLLTAMS